MKQLRPSAYGGSVKLDSSSKSTFNVKIADDPGDVDIPGVGKKNFRIYFDGGEFFDLDTITTPYDNVYVNHLNLFPILLLVVCRLLHLWTIYRAH